MKAEGPLVEAGTVVVVDPSPLAGSMTTAPIVATGCRCRTVATAAEALDACALFPPTLVMVDARIPTPPLERQPEASRIAGRSPLVLMVEPETDRAQLEAWATIGAIDCVMRPLRLHDVQLRLTAAKAGPKPDVRNAPRRVLLASDDALDLRRLDGLLQLNGFHVNAVNLAQRQPSADERCDLLVLVARSPAGELLRQLRTHPALKDVPAIVLSNEVAFPSSAKVALALNVNAAPDDVVRAVNGDRRVTQQLRAHQRVPFFAAIEFRETGNPLGRWLAGYTSNLSPGGLFVRSLAGARSGAALELKVHLNGRQETLTGTGVVAWSNGWGTRGAFHFSVGMGIQFIGLDAAARARVTRLCEG